MENETYFNIKIFRFYIKCTRCSSEITFKTDPKNTDYIAEHGAARNFEPWREQDGPEDEDKLAKLEREEADEEDPMKALENRTVDSKREMDILDKLQEIRGRNARLERADAEKVLERISSRRAPEEMDEEERLAEIQRAQEEDEDEELVRKYFAKGVIPPPPDIELHGQDAEGAVGDVDGLGEDNEGEAQSEAGPSGTNGGSEVAETPTAPPKPPAVQAGPSVKRKLVDVEPDAHSLLSEEARKIAGSVSFKPPPLPKKKQKSGSGLPGVKLKPKVKP